MWKNNFWSCPCFPSCSPPIHFPTIDRSWVAGWATSSQALVAQERLPRPAIRQITHTELQTHHSHLYPSNPLSFHKSHFVPNTLTWTMTPTCILPNLRPFPFSFFDIFRTYQMFVFVFVVSLLALWPLHPADRRLLLTVYQEFNITPLARGPLV